MTDKNWWENALDRLSQSQNLFFPQEGKNRFRLFWAEGRDELPYVEVTSYWQGKPRRRYMMMGYSPDDQTPIPRGIVLARTAFRSIIDLVSEGYELFDPERGHGITIIRSGRGLDTSYTVIASMHPIPIPDELKEQLSEFDLSAVARSYEEGQRQRSGVRESSSVEDSSAGEEGEDW